MNFGARLRVLREKKGLTQQNLANILGVSRSAVTGYETKNLHPDFDKLKILAKYLDVSTDILLGMDEFEFDKYEKDFSIDSVIDQLPKKGKDELLSYLDYLIYKYEKL